MHGVVTSIGCGRVSIRPAEILGSVANIKKSRLVNAFNLLRDPNYMVIERTVLEDYIFTSDNPREADGVVFICFAKFND